MRTLDRLPLIETKLQPPVLPPTVQRRGRLSALLSQAADYRTTLVVAPAGYGKTTTLAELASTSPRVVWYTLSASDHDPVVFLTHLVAALKSYAPALARMQVENYRPPGSPSQLSLEPLMAAIVNGLNADGRLLRIVLDDFHVATEERALSQTVNWLIQHAPRHLHFVLAARSMPRLPVLPRLCASRQALIIDEQDLRFTQDEIRALLAQEGLVLTAEELSSVEEETEGWALGLQLVTQYLASGGSVQAFRAGLSSARARLFEYLAEEVLQTQPDPIREFMLRSSVLRVMDAESVDAVLGGQDSAELLAQVEARNLFVHRVGQSGPDSAVPAGLRYHNLMQDFLQLWLQRDRDLWTGLNRAAATYYESKGSLELAYGHWAAAQEWDNAARVLLTLAPRAIALGRYSAVGDWLSEIPDRVEQRFPQLLLYAAQVLHAQGRIHAAFETYSRAIERLEQTGPKEALVDALRGKGMIYRDKGMAERAAETYARAFDQVQEDDLGGRAGILSQLAVIDASTGHLDRAEDRLLTAIRLYEEASDVRGQYSAWNSLARVVRIRQGRFAEALEASETALRLARELGSPIDVAEAGNTYATVQFLMGDYALARQVSSASLTTGIQLGAQQVIVDSLVTTGHTLLFGADRNLDAAEGMYVEAFTRLASSDSQHYLGVDALLGRSRLERAQGNHRMSANLARQARQSSLKRGHKWLTLVATLEYAVSSWLSEDRELARDLLVECEQGFREYGDEYHLACTLLWRSSVAAHEERPRARRGDASALFTSCLQLVRDREYLALLARESSVSTPLLVEYLGNPELADTAEAALLLAGPEAVPALSGALDSGNPEAQRRAIALLGTLGDERARKPLRGQLSDRRLKPLIEDALAKLRPRPGYTVTIKMLGPFEVRRGDEAVAEKEWRTARAKSLLQFLASRRGQLLSKERILETLWSDVDPEGANNNFRFTLNVLNKVLEPARPEGSSPYFVVRRGDAYGIDPAAEVVVDSEEFSRLVHEARSYPRRGSATPDEAVELYQAALALYEDDYLPEQVYEDWTSADRERLRELYFLAAGELAEIMLARGELDQVIELSRSILDKDPCREDAARLLMRAHLTRGDRTAAVRAYQACVAALDREFGLDPLPETRQLYDEIRSARR